MIKNPILYKISWYLLEKLHSKNLNYLYVDTLAKENVLQQKTESNRDYTLTSDYKLCFLPCSQFDTIQSIKSKQQINPLFSVHSKPVVCNDDLCKITGINYYGLVNQYQKNICVVDLDEIS